MCPLHSEGSTTGMTSEPDRRRLLEIARRAIEAHTANRPLPVPDVSGVLGTRGGAFVTLHTGSELRGCIGHVEADQPLGEVVPRCAIAAASEDPRFPPVTENELRRLVIELSLLGMLEPLAGPAEVEIGRHGLVASQGGRRGLLLPQVAVEWDWDAEAFLAHTCHKAGLLRDAWKRGANLWRFEAEVFAEPPTE
jgi:AmmeMemoRadiSam system protein A